MIRGAYSTPVVTLAESVVLGANPKRKTIVFSNPSANPIWLAFGQAAVANQGIQLPINTLALTLKDSEFGSLLHVDVHAITTVASGNIGILVGED